MLYSYTYVSLDGVMSSPETWVGPYFSPELGADLMSRLRSSAAMVLGRRTYQEFAAFWPLQGKDVPFSEENNQIKKLVVTSTLKGVTWNNSTIITVEELMKYKIDRDLHVTGSQVTIQSLMNAELIDELWMIVFPIVLGSGNRLFEKVNPTRLELSATVSFPNGVLGLSYRPIRSDLR